MSDAGDESGAPQATSPVAADALRTIPLLNSMVDVALVFGFDETCSRELVVLDEDEDLDVYFDSISQRELKLHFLQIVTPGQAYPERCDITTADYSVCQESSSPEGQRDLEGSSGGQEMSTSPLPSGGQGKKNFNVEDFGLTWETIETMHFFIFPEGKNKGPSTPTSASKAPPPILHHAEGPHIYGNLEDLPPSVLPLLFTNIMGERSFSCVLRFPRPFIMNRVRGCGCYTLTPCTSDMTTPPWGSKLVYLPTCVVLVSKRPCFQFMKNALSGFYESLEDHNFWEALKIFCERVFLVPALPPGSLTLEFQLPGFQSNLVVGPPRGGISVPSASGGISHTPPHSDQYLDIRFNYPFMCLSVDNILQVISALLTGQAVLFVSSLYPMLTYVIQSFLTYITPFVWRHAVVPILPYPLLEVLDAPVATVIGIHASLTAEPEFKRVDNHVIVDLDNDTVTVKLQDDSGPLPPLPRAAVENFKLKYSLLQKQMYEVEAMQRLSPTSNAAQLKERELFEQNMDDSLSKLFLELMVRLFHKVTKQLLQSRVKYEEAVKAMNPEDRNFYRQMESTDLFTAFYQSQKQGMQSDFNLLAIRVEREERRQISGDVEESYRRKRSSIISSGISSGAISSLRAKHRAATKTDSFEDSVFYHRVPSLGSVASYSCIEPTRIELPALGSEFRGREAFLDEVIDKLNELQMNKAVEAQCVYLRGYYLMCKREVSKAFEDHFGTLRRLDVMLVPQLKSIQGLLPFLSKAEAENLSSNSYFKSLNNRRLTFSRQSSSISMDLDRTMPRKPINHANFMKLVRENAIASDAESASNLHAVLSLERTTVVSPDTFKVFHQAWKLVLEENKNVELPNIELGRAENGHRINERVLSVASCIRTNFGSQSTLVLTTYRLLAVTGFSTHVLANFSVPMRFENFSYATNFIGAKNPGIRIEMLGKQRTDKKKAPQDLYMAFQDHLERDNWYHMLVEMLAGWHLSQRLKDPCVMETAQGHVILQNSINQSGLMDQFNPTQRRKKALKLLSFQSKDVSESSPITGEALQYRINPCLHETDRQTVESLLYIPPFCKSWRERGKEIIGVSLWLDGDSFGCGGR